MSWCQAYPSRKILLLFFLYNFLKKEVVYFIQEKRGGEENQAAVETKVKPGSESRQKRKNHS
jgi:uncharacterized membrane protein